MIDLERNKKTKELLEAKGKRTQERSILHLLGTGKVTLVFTMTAF